MTVVPIVNGTSVAVSDMFEEYIGKIIYEQKRSDKKNALLATAGLLRKVLSISGLK